MDEVKARVKLAESEIQSPLGVSLPRSEVERALHEEMDAELTLDVIRSNGSTDRQRLTVMLDEATLRRLVEQEGEQVRVVIDPNSLQAAFDEVEAHGLREGMATLAILVTAAAGGAGMAGAAVDQSTGTGAQSTPSTFVAGVTDFPSIAAVVETPDFQPGVTDFPSGVPGAPSVAQSPAPETFAAAARQHAAERDAVPEAGMPRAMPADYAAAAEDDRLAAADIEQVRVGGTAVPDPDSAIENVRATRDLAPTGDSGGIDVSAPGTAASIALAGGVVLTIAAAVFALRRRREPEPAT